MEKIALPNLHQCLLNVYGDLTVDMSTVKRGVVHFSSGDSDSGSPLLVQISTSVAGRFLFITGENA